MELSIPEAARLLHTSESTIYRWIDQGEIPAHLVNEQYRIGRADLLEWATENHIRVSVDLFDRGEESNQSLPGLDAALEAGGVHHDVPGSDRESSLRAVVSRLALAPDTDPELLVGMLLARERLGTTAVGDGIAIPHVRVPLVLPGSGAGIALCFLAAPVDLEASDGKPVFAMFMMITPTIRAHHHLLTRLSSALHDAGFREAVQSRAPKDRILKEARRVEAGFLVSRR